MHKVIVILLGIFLTIPTAHATVPLKELLPKNCKVLKGNKKKGYRLQCKKILPFIMPKWKFDGIDIIPVDKKTFLERRVWTRDDWQLHEIIFCDDTKCSPPLIRMFDDEFCRSL